MYECLCECLVPFLPNTLSLMALAADVLAIGNLPAGHNNDIALLWIVFF